MLQEARSTRLGKCGGRKGNRQPGHLEEGGIANGSEMSKQLERLRHPINRPKKNINTDALNHSSHIKTVF